MLHFTNYHRVVNRNKWSARWLCGGLVAAFVPSDEPVVIVTFAEIRCHFGVETQRQSSEPAVDRTTPVGLFSLITL
jgi:hypothetical protein